ncbi:MAG TPA: IPT/TIG domain-containing protein [Thermoanaerobaculia bacterium]|nr:IPT/TIG domain-containing protein [Thermoanaerobaculia bacterium]
MRRIAIGTTALALVAHLIGCAADAPTAPKPGGGGSSSGGALAIALFTNDPNPPAGACTLIQAVATLNGSNVPDGTGIAFSTDLGTFAQNSKPTVSIVVSGGSAVTSVCSPQSGVANVRASVSVAGQNASANLSISFQPSSSSAFVSFCTPSFGSSDGGTALTINGGGFYGSAGTTRVDFTAAGITRSGLVTSVSGSQIVVTTPGFPEANSSPVLIRITLGVGTTAPTTLTAPTCFVYGTQPVGTPVVNAVLPSSGKNEGNTKVSIIGGGFVAPVQVFFGVVEATVLSVSFNQIVALSPPAFGVGSPNLNQTVDVRVHEVNSGKDGTLAGAFRYAPAMMLTGFTGANVQPSSGPFTPLTIHGQGFEAPVQVGLAGIVAAVMSVSATELVVLPGATLNCSGASGTITVVNLTTGEEVEGLSFQYTANAPTITSVTPSSFVVPPGGTTLVITGTNLTNTSVTFGGATAAIVSSSPTGDSITIVIPESGAAAPTCGGQTTGTPLPVGSPVSITVSKLSGTCSATAAAAFQYLLPCVP